MSLSYLNSIPRKLLLGEVNLKQPYVIITEDMGTEIHTEGVRPGLIY